MGSKIEIPLPASFEAMPAAQKAEGIALRGRHADTPEAQKKAAAEFEGLLFQEMMKSMWQSVSNEGLLSGTKEEGMYRDMLNEAVAKEVADGQGIGIKQVIMKELKGK